MSKVDENQTASKPKRGGLGRGLSALIPQVSASSAPAKSDPNFRFIPLKSISLNPLQPRKTFGREELDDLIASVREHGVLQPIVVRPKPGSNASASGYELVAGERRFRAASAVGLTEIPAVIRDIDERSSLALALIENIQREDLHILEAAQAYGELIETYDMTQTELARIVGKSQPQIANALRLLHLPVQVQNGLKSGQISEGHAKVILTMDGEEMQVSLWKHIVAEELTVRESEKRAGELRRWERDRSKPTVVRTVAAPDPQLEIVGRKIGDRIGTKVRVVPGRGQKGVIEITYFDSEHLEGLIEKLTS